jgi:hypothetical protein
MKFLAWNWFEFKSDNNSFKLLSNFGFPQKTASPCSYMLISIYIDSLRCNRK